jgi:glutaminase
MFDDHDVALEWCEDQWLNTRRPPRSDTEPITIEEYELFQGLTPEEIRLIANVLEHRCYRRSEVMVEMGAAAREVFLLSRGSVIVTLKLGNGAQRRLGVLSPGMAFGEVGMLDQAPRSAVVTAESDVECHLLKKEDFEALGETHPRIKITLLRNMTLGIARLLRKATREIGVFDY